MWSWDQLTSCQTDMSDLIGLHHIITILPWLCKYRHGVMIAYFACSDFSWNLNGTRYWYQQVHTRSLKMQTCFFISFWRTKSSRAFSWSSLVQYRIRWFDHWKHTLQNWQRMRFSTRSLPEPSVHEKRGAMYVGPCSSFSGKIPQSRIYSLLPPHQPRVETGKAATKLLLQFSTTIERLRENGWSFEDSRYLSTWFEEPSCWLLLHTHIYHLYPFNSIYMYGLVSAPKHQT